MVKLARMRLNKRGFTLIEVIVASTIMFIIIAAALSFFLPMTDNMRKTKYMADARMLSEMVYDGLRAKIQYAESISVETGLNDTTDRSDGKTHVIYSVPDADVNRDLDLLMCNGNPLVAEGFYDRIRFDITYEVVPVVSPVAPAMPAENVLNVTITTHLPNRTSPITTVTKSFTSLNKCTIEDKTIAPGPDVNKGLLIKFMAETAPTPP